MKKLIFVFLCIVISSCATQPTSKDFMDKCRLLCKGNVADYNDDTVSCKCQLRKE